SMLRIMEAFRQWGFPVSLGSPPVPQVFSSISAGRRICALTKTGAAYCWGAIGTATRWEPERGMKIFSLSPRRVRGPLRFKTISAGVHHTCALTVDGAAYCWGSNKRGQLGNNSKEDSLVPVPVSGGLQFRLVTVDEYNTCAITTSDTAYCWG